MAAILHAPAHQGKVAVAAPLVLPALEHRRQQIQFGQDVAQARRNHFAALERSAQRAQRHIGQQRERRRVAAELAVMDRRGSADRRARQQPAGPGPAPGPQGVGAGVAQMLPEQAMEGLQAALGVLVAQSQHLAHQVRVGADRSLAEYDQAARQDIGALDRDGDGHRAIQIAEIVRRTVDHRLAGVHVHRVVDRLAHALGGVVFHDGGDHRRLVPLVQRRAGQAARGLDQIGVARQPRQLLLHTLELADRDAELAADTRVHAGGARADHGRRGRQRRQRDAAAGGQRAHQHLPALAGARRSADQGLDRHEDIAAAVGAVLEYLHGRQMAPADFHAGRLGGHQRHRNADIGRTAQQALEVGQLERQAQHRGHRPQRDVALVPVQAYAQHLASIHHLAAHHAGVGHGGRVRAGLGAGQAEARHLGAVGQARQPEFALLGRAELQQQLARSERIRHHHGHPRRDRISRNAPHHLRMRIRRKAQAAVLLGNDHAEKALRFHELPDRLGQIAARPGDVPFVQHGAQLRHRAIDEALLGGRQLGRRHIQQLAPIGIAGEQVGVPPDIAGLDGLAFGVRHAGHGLARPAKCGFGDTPAAPSVEIHAQFLFVSMPLRPKLPELTGCGQCRASLRQ
ncbi:Uncharacterised protein [Bordetella pertussis]|nr:Uncharacterised protein [Bordetella pertussis]